MSNVLPQSMQDTGVSARAGTAMAQNEDSRSTTVMFARIEPDEQPLYSYQDYRTFLSDHFKAACKRNPSWSWQAWAKKLGLKNNTSLLKIIHGQREAGPEITEKLIKSIGLKDNEAKYFRALVALSKTAKTPDVRSLILEQLVHIHPKRRFMQLDEATFAAISAWYGFALRQLTKLKDFKSSAECAAKMLGFGVGVRDIRIMVSKLKSLGLLAEDKHGRWTAPLKSLNTSDDVACEPLKRFHEATLENAKKALREIPVDRRQVSGLTLAVHDKDIVAAKEFIRRFEDEFLARFGAPSDADHVYQLETAFFPLTKSYTKQGA